MVLFLSGHCDYWVCRLCHPGASKSWALARGPGWSSLGSLHAQRQLQCSAQETDAKAKGDQDPELQAALLKSEVLVSSNIRA